MEIYKADEGKVFTIPGTNVFAKTIYLGKGDSIDRYIQVDESERDEYNQEQERKEKEEELRRLLLELYPQEAEVAANEDTE